MSTETTEKEIEEYCGYSIKYNIEKSEFVATSGEPEDGIIKGETLKAVRNKIDNVGKTRSPKQPKQPALEIEVSRWGQSLNYTMRECTIGAIGTIISGWQSGRIYAWVTYGKRRRERVEISESNYTRFYEDTPEAREIVKQVQKIGKDAEKHIEQEKEKQEKLIKKLKPIKAKVEKLPEWER